MTDKKLIEIYSHLLYESIKDLLQEDNSDDKIFSMEDLRIILTRFSINSSVVISKLLNVEEQLVTMNLTVSKIVDEALDCLKDNELIYKK